MRDHVINDGISHVDTLILTHPDADHAGGCDEVLSSVSVSHIVHPGSSKDTNTWEDCRHRPDTPPSECVGSRLRTP